MYRKIMTVIFCSVSLFAQEKQVIMAPISVLATGVEESVLEQPLSVLTKEKAEVELDQVIYQKDLLNSLAGVQIEQTGSVIGHTTAIRMPENKSAYYQFLQDGLPVQSSGFFNHNGLAYTSFQSASSVEVLKGAGTALYGSDAVAAVIDVASLAKPSKDKEVILKATGGSDGFLSSSIELSESEKDGSGYRINSSYMHSDGWREHTETKHFEANIRYDKIIDDFNDIQVMFNASISDAKQADSFNDYENIKNQSTLASDDASYINALSLTDVRRKFDFARLSLAWNNYAFENLEISLTPYIRYNRNRYVATWEKNLPSNDNEIVSFGLVEKNTLDTSWGKVITGLDAEYTQSHLDYIQNFDVNVTGFGAANYPKGAIFDYDVDYIALAPYIHVEYAFTDTLELQTGLRFDYNRFTYTNNLQANSNDGSGKYFRLGDTADSFSHLSPKLSLNYKMNASTNIYIRYANGFRIPQASRLYSLKAGYSTLSLNPETSDSYELGFKKAFSEKSFMEMALYYMSIDDTITRYASGGGTYYYDNGGESIHRGIELTLKAQLTQDIASHFAYSYALHNYVDNSTYENNTIAQAPEHLANVRLVYTPSFIAGLSLLGEWQYVGTYWMDDAHTKSYGGYSIANLKASYIYSPNLTFFTKVSNLTDEAYAVSANYAYGSENYTPGDPRQLYGGLEYRW